MSDIPEYIGGSEPEAELSSYRLTGDFESLPLVQRNRLLHLIGGYGLGVTKVTVSDGEVTTEPIEVEPEPEVRLLSRRDLDEYLEWRGLDSRQAAKVWGVLLGTAMDGLADERPTIISAQRGLTGVEQYPPVRVHDQTGREITSYDELWQMRRGSKPTTRIDICSVYARLVASKRSAEAWKNSRNRVPTLNLLISWVNDTLQPDEKLALWEE